MKMAVEPVTPGVVKVILDGRMDITGAAVIDLQFSAITGSNKGVVVDLTNVSFLASIGIRTLSWRQGCAASRWLLHSAQSRG